MRFDAALRGFDDLRSGQGVEWIPKPGRLLDCQRNQTGWLVV